MRRITAVSSRSFRRESIWENTDLHSHIQGQGRGRDQVRAEGAEAGPHRDRGPDLDPDLGDPGGDPDPGALGLTVELQYRRLNSSWNLT